MTLFRVFAPWSPSSSFPGRVPPPVGTARGLPASQVRRADWYLVLLSIAGVGLSPVDGQSSAPDDGKAPRLRGSIQLRIDDPANPRRRNLRLDQPGALPVRKEVTLDEQNRTAPSGKTRKSNDPVLRPRRLLREKLQPLGDYSQAVLFLNQGG